jgi:FtsH-binding integral membrane protein
MGLFNDKSGSLPLGEQLRVELRPLMRQVYAWMTTGLIVTAATALITTSVEPIRMLAFNPIVLLIAIIAELGLVFALSLGIRSFSVSTATILFYVYAALNGFTLSVVLLYFSGYSVVLALVGTAVLFGTMTVIGLTTQADLTKLGTIMIVGLIALIITSVINIFLRSSGLEFIISIAGVLIFTALTAYDTQKIKRMAADPTIQEEGTELLTKLSILGALTLYLDFINLFLFLLRLFGSGRD